MTDLGAEWFDAVYGRMLEWHKSRTTIFDLLEQGGDDDGDQHNPETARTAD